MQIPAFMIDRLRHDRPGHPQTYREHGRFAMKHSCWLVAAGLAGMIHAICPWWFKFYTAEQVVRIYGVIARCGRHDELIRKYDPGRPSRK